MVIRGPLVGVGRSSICHPGDLGEEGAGTRFKSCLYHGRPCPKGGRCGEACQLVIHGHSAQAIQHNLVREAGPWCVCVLRVVAVELGSPVNPDSGFSRAPINDNSTDHLTDSKLLTN